MLRVDDALCDMMAQPAATMIGRSVLDITFPPDRQACARCMTRLRDAREPFTIVKRMMRQDGSPFWVTKTVALVDFGDAPASVLATVTRATPGDMTATPSALLREARLLLEDVAARRRWMDSTIFVDPQSSILLSAYVAEAEGTLADIDVMAAVAGVAIGVLVRWTRAMAAEGLIEIDGRHDASLVSFRYRLTKETLDRCEQYLAHRVQVHGRVFARA